MTQEEIKTCFEQYWPVLAASIDQVMGQHIATSKGFQLLSNEVLRRTGKNISSSTLKRVYGYVNENVETRESTLDLLALFAGYGTWMQFCKSQKTSAEATPSSGFVNARKVEVSELPVNAIVRLSWAPDRICSCLYRGSCSFEVLRSENTRLVPGTTFSCHLILSDQQLILDNVCIGGQGLPVTYAVGKVYGVQFDLIIP